MHFSVKFGYSPPLKTEKIEGKIAKIKIKLDKLIESKKLSPDDEKLCKYYVNNLYRAIDKTAPYNLRNNNPKKLT